MEIYGSYNEIFNRFNEELNCAKQNGANDEEVIKVLEEDMQELLRELKLITLKDNEQFYVFGEFMDGFNYEVQRDEEE